MDCFSRRVVGWSVASHTRTNLVADALKMALATRGQPQRRHLPQRPRSAIPARQVAYLCAEVGATQDMGAVGVSADNAACESFHASLKRETLKGARCGKRAPQPRAYETSRNMALAAQPR
ncbi:DDE-type integrase/transposase/recombinase [Streptomyces sp. NPDC059009]|uniref:DDE-type integrase/transposase/recombinase n=1 Tax=Streptomyces sp. NPDC059009 TaxID=3346694 RepID=UPI0036BFDB35